MDATLEVSVQNPVELKGSSLSQFYSIIHYQMFSKVFKAAMSLRRKISRHVENVRKEEQPYHRVRTLVEDARRRKKVSPANMPQEMQTVQMSQSVRATALMLRFDLALLGKFINVKQNTKQTMATIGPKLTVNLTANRDDCLKLVDAAQQAKMPAQQAEGHILFARYLALELSVAHSASEEATNLEGAEIVDNATAEQTREQSRQDGYQHLRESRQLCEAFPGQCKGQISEIEPAEQALRGFFVSEVTNEERYSRPWHVSSRARAIGTPARTDIRSVLANVGCPCRLRVVQNVVDLLAEQITRLFRERKGQMSWSVSSR